MNKVIALEPCVVYTNAWYNFEEVQVKDEDGELVTDPLTDAPMTELKIIDWNEAAFYDEPSYNDMLDAGILNMFGPGWEGKKADA